MLFASWCPSVGFRDSILATICSSIFFFLCLVSSWSRCSRKASVLACLNCLQNLPVFLQCLENQAILSWTLELELFWQTAVFIVAQFSWSHCQLIICNYRNTLKALSKLFEGTMPCLPDTWPLSEIKQSWVLTWLSNTALLLWPVFIFKGATLSYWSEMVELPIMLIMVFIIIMIIMRMFPMFNWFPIIWLRWRVDSPLNNHWTINTG